MATSVYYSGVGKSLIINNSTFFTFYGQDFNPNTPPSPSTWNKSTTYASGETSYNLSGFQVGNEVCCGLFGFENNASSSVYVSWDMYFQKSYNGSTYYNAGWDESRGADVAGSGRYFYYNYVGVDDDEIWIGANYYRFHIEWSSTDGSSGTINIPFTVSNLSFESGLHKSGYFRVEGNYLCYIDGTGWEMGNNGYGYKHKINYDTGYSGGSGNPGYVWIPSSNDNHIYYTSANGTVRRTHISSSWYGYYGSNYAPSGAKPGMIWVSDGGYQDGYGYLCYVNSQGQLRRMGNGEP